MSEAEKKTRRRDEVRERLRNRPRLRPRVYGYLTEEKESLRQSAKQAKLRVLLPITPKSPSSGLMLAFSTSHLGSMLPFSCTPVSRW